MEYCSTCHEKNASKRCATCKGFTFCGSACFDGHPTHNELCWDKSSTDRQYVGEKLRDVLPLMRNFTEDDQMHAVGVCCSLLENPTGSPNDIDYGHEIINDIIHDPHTAHFIKNVASDRKIKKLAATYSNDVIQTKDIDLQRHYLAEPLALIEGEKWDAFKAKTKEKYKKGKAWLKDKKSKLKAWRKKKKKKKDDDDDDDDYEHDIDHYLYKKRRREHRKRHNRRF